MQIDSLRQCNFLHWPTFILQGQTIHFRRGKVNATQRAIKAHPEDQFSGRKCGFYDQMTRKRWWIVFACNHEQNLIVSACHFCSNFRNRNQTSCLQQVRLGVRILSRWVTTLNFRPPCIAVLSSPVVVLIPIPCQCAVSPQRQSYLLFRHLSLKPARHEK